MSLETLVNKVICQGNSAASTFSYSFIIPTADDVVATFTDTDGTQTVLTSADYTITGLGDANGGTVTYPIAGSPMITGQSLTIQRIVSYTQPTVLGNQGAYYPDAVEGADDYIVMQTQQLDEQLQRAIVANPADTGTFDYLPVAANRAGLYLVFDANGDPTVSSGTGADAGLRADLAASDGGTLVGFIQPGTGAVAGTTEAKLRQRVCVFDFMTTAEIADVQAGTAAVDVLAAIDAAILAVYTAGGGEVYFPTGIYSTSAAITWWNRVALIGESKEFTKISCTDNTVAVLAAHTPAGSGGGFSNDSGVAMNLKNLWLEHAAGTMSANLSDDVGAYGIAITEASFKAFRWEDVAIYNCHTGIYATTAVFGGAGSVRISNCYTGIYASSTATSLDFTLRQNGCFHGMIWTGGCSYSTFNHNHDSGGMVVSSIAPATECPVNVYFDSARGVHFSYYGNESLQSMQMYLTDFCNVSVFGARVIPSTSYVWAYDAARTTMYGITLAGTTQGVFSLSSSRLRISDLEMSMPVASGYPVASANGSSNLFSFDTASSTKSGVLIENSFVNVDSYYLTQAGNMYLRRHNNLSGSLENFISSPYIQMFNCWKASAQYSDNSLRNYNSDPVTMSLGITAGTATISFTADDTAAVVSTSATFNQLSWTKVGRRVFINGEIRMDSTGFNVPTTGDIYISGLPFAASTTAGYTGGANSAVQFEYYGLDAVVDGNVTGSVASNATTLTLNYSLNGQYNPLATKVTSGTRLKFAGQYISAT